MFYLYFVFMSMLVFSQRNGIFGIFRENPGDFPRDLDSIWAVPDIFFSSGLNLDSAGQPPQTNPSVPVPGPGGERALSPDLRGSENLQILRLTRVEEVH